MGKNNEDAFVGLSKALEALRVEWPDAPIHALRSAVVEGRIPSKRSSGKAGARYYVRMSELRKAMPVQA